MLPLQRWKWLSPQILKQPIPSQSLDFGLVNHDGPFHVCWRTLLSFLPQKKKKKGIHISTEWWVMLNASKPRDVASRQHWGFFFFSPQSKCFKGHLNSFALWCLTTVFQSNPLLVLPWRLLIKDGSWCHLWDQMSQVSNWGLSPCSLCTQIPWH